MISHDILLPLEVKGISNLTEIGFRSSDYLNVLSELNSTFLKSKLASFKKMLVIRKIFLYL